MTSRVVGMSNTPKLEGEGAASEAVGAPSKKARGLMFGACLGLASRMSLGTAFSLSLGAAIGIPLGISIGFGLGATFAVAFSQIGKANS